MLENIGSVNVAGNALGGETPMSYRIGSITVALVLALALALSAGPAAARGAAGGVHTPPAGGHGGASHSSPVSVKTPPDPKAVTSRAYRPPHH